MPSKIYVYAILFFLFVGFVKWAHYQVDMGGYNRHKAEVADQKDDHVTEGEEKVKIVIKWRTKEKVIYRDKVKKIYINPDPTGCRDTKLIDMGIGLH